MKKRHIDTDLLDRAIIFAVQAHKGVERKGKGFPYVVHPMEAVEIVATMTNDQHMLAAAALHDVIEDTDTTADDLRREFGERVALLVEAESDIQIEGDRSESWHARKQAAIEHLAHASHDVKVVALGDKLSNMRAIARDFATQGNALWDLFNVKDVKEHEWHYRGLAESLRELQDTFAYKEFEQLIDQVFGKKSKA